METSRRTSSTSSELTSFRFAIALHAASAPVCLFVTRYVVPNWPSPRTCGAGKKGGKGDVSEGSAHGGGTAGRAKTARRSRDDTAKRRGAVGVVAPRGSVVIMKS